MIPVVTPDEMRAIDAAAPEPVGLLIDRAGSAVARTAVAMMGGTYGRRVVVVAGKGNNGADGRVAAARLRARGVRVAVIDAAGAPPAVPPCDLVIDAAYGTGFRGAYDGPATCGVPVLAVDVPSGSVRADRTVTFAALKPSLLLGEGRERAGVVEIADIGLDVSGARMHLLEDADISTSLPPRTRDAHKWQTAVCVVGGSLGMMGAPVLAARGALRAGAGFVRLGVPGGAVGAGLMPGSEMVAFPLEAGGWAGAVLERLDRCRALVIGPGLGRDEATLAAVREVLGKSSVPTVVDADALTAVDPELTAARQASTVLTPHDGEFARIAGSSAGEDRIADVRRFAAATGAIVLLKGLTTVVAAPDGRVLLAASGDSRLATAGTGDVLSGLIGAFLARGVDAHLAAAMAAHAHGAASARGFSVGLVAGDLPDLVAAWLSDNA